MATIRVAHVSDLHLTAAEGAYRSEPKLWGRLRGMNRRCRILFRDRWLREADAVIASGDVSDQGEPGAWAVFWEAVAEAGIGDRLVVVPGNHDVCSLGLRRRRPADDHRADLRAALEAGGQPVNFPALWRPAGGDLAVLGLDSTHYWNDGVLDNAIGRIDFEQLARLGRRLREISEAPVADRPRALLLVLHHAPHIAAVETSHRRGEAAMSALDQRLMEVERQARHALRLLARVFHVKAILHGHTHHGTDQRVAGVRMVGCPASTQPDADGCVQYRALELDLERDRLSVRTRRVRTD